MNDQLANDRETARALRLLLDSGGAMGTTAPDCEIFQTAGANDGDGLLWVGVEDRSQVTGELEYAAGVLVADWLGRRAKSKGNGRRK